MTIKVKQLDILDLIIIIICNYYNISKDELTERTNARDISFIRYQVFYFHKLYVKQGVSLVKLASSLGLTNHATVLHGIKEVNSQIDVSKEVNNDIKILTTIIDNKIRVAKLTNSYLISVKLHNNIKHKVKHGKRINKIRSKN